jgi:hypothetical protein
MRALGRHPNIVALHSVMSDQASDDVYFGKPEWPQLRRWPVPYILCATAMEFVDGGVVMEYDKVGQCFSCSKVRICLCSWLRSGCIANLLSQFLAATAFCGGATQC